MMNTANKQCIRQTLFQNRKLEMELLRFFFFFSWLYIDIANLLFRTIDPFYTPSINILLPMLDVIFLLLKYENENAHKFRISLIRYPAYPSPPFNVSDPVPRAHLFKYYSFI